MPYTVELRDGTTVEFDDSVPPEQAERELRKKFPSLTSKPLGKRLADAWTFGMNAMQQSLTTQAQQQVATGQPTFEERAGEVFKSLLPGPAKLAGEVLKAQKPTAEELRKKQKELQTAMREVQPSDVMQQFETAFKENRAWEYLKEHGPELALEAWAVSIPQTLPALGTQAAAAVVPGGPVFKRALQTLTAGGSSAWTEYNAEMNQWLLEKGYDLSEPGVAEKVFNNPKLVAEMQKHSETAARDVGLLDALGYALGTKVLAPSKLRPATKEAVNLTAQGLAVQPATGAAGEALKQVELYGKVTKPHEVALEALGEIPGGIAEVGMAALSGAREPSSTGVPEPVLRAARQRAMAEFIRRAVDETEPGKPTPVYEPDKRMSWEESLARVRRDLDQPVQEAQTSVTLQSTEPEALASELGERIALKPQQAEQIVLGNVNKLAAAEVNLPAVVSGLVETGRLTAKQGADILQRVESRMSDLVAEAEQSALAVEERYEKEAEAYTQQLGLGKATNPLLEQQRAALERLLYEEGINNDMLQGPPGEVVKRLAEAGLPGYLAQIAASAPDDRRRAALLRMHNLVDRLATTYLHKPTDHLSDVAKGWDVFDEKQIGKVVTFGPQRGKAVGLRWDAAGGTVNSINEAPNLVSPHVERKIVAILRRWTAKFMPGDVDVIVHFSHIAEYAGSMYMKNNTQTGKPKTLVITLNAEYVAQNANTASLAQTLSHEFGHGLFDRLYFTASETMKAALREHWLRDLIAFWDKPLQEYVNAIHGPGVRYDVKTDRTLGSILMQNVAHGSPETSLSHYWPNFWEWTAGTMTRMLVSDYRDMSAPVRTFMQKAFAQLKKFFVSEHKLWDPNQTLEEWLRISSEYEINKLLAENKTAQLIGQAQAIGVNPFTPHVGGVDVQEETGDAILDTLSTAKSSQDAQDFTEGVQQLKRVLGRHPHGKNVLQSIVRFNETLATFLAPLQILKENRAVPGAIRFLNALRNKMAYKSQWTREAELITSDWDMLGKERAGRLAKLLMTEAMEGQWYSEMMPDPKRPDRMRFVLDENKAKEFGIDEPTAELYSRVRSAFMAALDAMEQLGRERIERQFQDDPSNPQMQAQLDELQQSYQNMREKPYTPFSRFGQYYVRIKAKEYGRFKDPITGYVKLVKPGETVYFETFETEAERNASQDRIKELYSGDALFEPVVDTGKMHEIVYSLRNLPPQFLQSLAARLELTPEQLSEYNELLKDLAADASFVKHMKRKANIAGYSPDALRGFADYFLRFANNYAKHKSAPEFDTALAETREFLNEIAARGEDHTNADRFYNWLVRTRDYVMNPGNEWAEFKSFVSAMYLGFNLATLAQNVSQVPFVTLPYLSHRFGTVQTLRALRKAASDVVRGFANPSVFSDAEQKMFAHALDSGFLNESYATILAQTAEGTALSRMTGTAFRQRVLNEYNYKAMWAFQKTEEFNRRVTMLATYRLLAGPPGAAGFDMNAFMQAREAVEVTQNEYMLENRPEFMRGKKSVVFQFMHYYQNMVYQMLGGDPSWKRLLFTQLAVAGLLGMPFADDLLSLAKFLAKKAGVYFEPELELRKLLRDLDVNPDLVLRGMSSMVGDFDLSYRYSLGRAVPGLEALASNKPFAEAVTDAVGDVGGAGAALIMNALKAASNIDSPDKLKTLSYVSPAFVRYILNAMRAHESGGVTTRDGALIAPLGPGEIAGMAVGMQPRAASKAWMQVGFQREIEAYWQTRRGVLLYNWYVAVRSGDREAIADVRKRLNKFNREVAQVDKAGIIGADTLRRSFLQRARAAQRHEELGTPTAYTDIARDIKDATEE